MGNEGKQIDGKENSSKENSGKENSGGKNGTKRLDGEKMCSTEGLRTKNANKEMIRKASYKP